MSPTRDYDAVRKDIVAQLKKPDYDDGSAGPVFVRLAWYAVPIHKEAFIKEEEEEELTP